MNTGEDERKRLRDRLVLALGSGGSARLRDEYGAIGPGEVLEENISRIALALERVSRSRAYVGLLFGNSAALATSIIACLQADRVPVILNPASHRKRQEPRWAEDVGFDAVLLEAGGELPAWRGAVHASAIYVNRQAVIESVVEREGSRKATIAPAQTALVLETSGSTGGSKAVEITPRALNFVFDFLVPYLGLDSSTHSMIVHPLHHTFALNSQFFPTILAGGGVEFVPVHYMLGSLLREIGGKEGVFLSLVAGAIDILHREYRNGAPQARGVRQVQLAGEAIHDRHIIAVREMFPHARVFKAYGLTEALRVAMIDDSAPSFSTTGAGFLLPGHSVKVSAAGQLFVKGPTLMGGYLGEKGPFTDSEGYFETGDTGRIENGILHVEGRTDQVFKRFGVKISPREVENVALEFPAVCSARCLAVPFGEEGSLEPVLFVEFNKVVDVKSNLFELERMLRAKLERRKRPLRIVPVKEIPLLESGKLDRERLLEILNASFTK